MVLHLSDRAVDLDTGRLGDGAELRPMELEGSGTSPPGPTRPCRTASCWSQSGGTPADRAAPPSTARSTACARSSVYRQPPPPPHRLRPGGGGPLAARRGDRSAETTLLHGMSAGGLLVGPALNQSPGLCAAVFAVVPFVDLLTAMLDPSLPLTTAEYEEWGDPAGPRGVPHDAVLLSLRQRPGAALPRHAGGRPSLEDPLVPYWGPVKWVARLRERATAGDLLLSVRSEAGHFGPSGRYRGMEAAARHYAWILDRLGLADTLPRDPCSLTRR